MTDERDPEEDRRKRMKKSHYDEEDDEERKEKRLTKMVGEVVVRSMSKYKEQMEHDTFKRYAKEVSRVFMREKWDADELSARLSLSRKRRRDIPTVHLAILTCQRRRKPR